jgi:hypothetical protein
MSDNEIDDITREFRQLGHAAASAVAQWQRSNPGKTKVPRRVRKDATRQLREAMRAHEQMLKEHRIAERASIEMSIGNHHSASLLMGQSAPGTPEEEYTRRQWSHAQRRHAVAMQIHRSEHLTREERGQAVMALTSAHYADNPNVPQRPVWGPKPFGLSALKARLAERVSRVREGLAQPQSRPSRPAAPKPIPKPRPERQLRTTSQPRGAGQPRAWAAPGSTADHPYWRSELPMQDQAMNARMAKMEAQLKELAEERDRLWTENLNLGEEVLDAHDERDQLQAKVTQLGEKVLDARQQHKAAADQLAQRGQELTDVHTELERVRTQRDEAVQKLVERTPAQERYGSPERQAEQAKAAARKAPETPQPAAPAEAQPPASKATESMIPPEQRKTPEDLSREAAQFRAGEWAKHENWKIDNLGPEKYFAEKEAHRATREAPQTEAPKVEAPEAPQAPEPELVGAVAGNPVGKAQRTQRINGSRKVINTVNEVRGGHTREQIGVVIERGRVKTPAAPEIPLPPEPFDGPEPPEFD